MGVSLTSLERETIEALAQTGMGRPEAIVAVAMVTRIRGRPESDLVDILTQFSGLEDPDVVRRAVHRLLRLGWLTEASAVAGQVRVERAGDLRTKIATTTHCPELATELEWTTTRLIDHVRVVGPMTDESTVYDSYIDLIREAQTQICIYMMTQSPQQALVPLFQERAERGVRVKILLAAPEVVVKFWGEVARAQAEYAIRGWCENADGIRNMDVRVSHSPADMEMATSVGFDNRIARIDVYDPRVQRSREGVLIEAASPEGLDLNLVRAFHRQFAVAWSAAHPANLYRSTWRHAWWHTIRQWRVWCAAILYAVFSFADGLTVVRAISFAVATTLLVEALVLARDRIGALRRFWAR
jgi:hypothetical protein